VNASELGLSLEYENEIKICDSEFYEYNERPESIGVFLNIPGFSPKLRENKRKQILDLYDKLREKYTRFDTEEAVVFEGSSSGTYEYDYDVNSSRHIPCPTDGRREIDISEAVNFFEKKFSQNPNPNPNHSSPVVTVYHNHNNATKFSQEDIRTFLETLRMHEMYIDSGLDIIFLIKNPVNKRIRVPSVISFDKIQNEVSLYYANSQLKIDEFYKNDDITEDEKDGWHDYITSKINYVKFAVASKVGLFRVDYGWVKKPQC